MDSEYKGHKVETRVECILDKYGYWKADIIITQAKSEDGETWKTRTVNMSAYDRSIDKALAQAQMSIAYYIDKCGGDLFSVDEEKKVDNNLLQQAS